MDIDIDVANRKELLENIEHRKASLRDGKVHNTGIYATEIPHNPLDNVSTLDYKTAEERGYFKIDILNVSVYNNIRDEEHLIRLMNSEPDWTLLQDEKFTENLFHVAGHHRVMQKLHPSSIEELAAALAIIRPAKKHLIDSDWDTINREIWKQPRDSSYAFKHSHALAYAYTVVVHMNLLCEESITGTT